MDKLVEATLHELMTKDKKWGEGGTKRVFQDKYQDYLRTNAIPVVEEAISEMLGVIVDEEYADFNKKLVEHLKDMTFNSAELEAI